MNYLFTILFAALMFACGSVTNPVQHVDFKAHWDTLRVLKNPHKGWYHHLPDNGIDNDAIHDDSLFRTFPGMDHLYLRLAWRYLEPSEGQFDWHRIDEVVEKYVPMGYQIAFRISCKETGPFAGSVGQQYNDIQHATPAWVEKTGAKGVVAQSGNIRSGVPDWGEPDYLGKLDNFHRAFAARYDSQPGVSYVDIGSIGEWGDGHTSFSTKIAPSVEEVKANMDIYRRNYKNSQLIINEEVIRVTQNNTGNREINFKDGVSIWIAKGKDNNTSYVAILNISDQPANLTISAQQLGLGPQAVVRDLWKKQAAGALDNLKGISFPLTEPFCIPLNNHHALL